MELSRVKALEIKLREMLKFSKQYQAEKNPKLSQINTGYIIPDFAIIIASKAKI